MSTTPVKAPEILDKIVDIVLAHRPKSASNIAKKKKKSGKTCALPATKTKSPS